MNISIKSSYKGGKKLKPTHNNIVIENKTRFDNNILLDMVNDIVNYMHNIKADAPNNVRVRFVFTECSNRVSGVVKTTYHRPTFYSERFYNFDVFVRIPKDKSAWGDVTFDNDKMRCVVTPNMDFISKLVDYIYRVTVHELQHLDDHLYNNNGGCLRFDKGNNNSGRRMKHDNRPEEVRANDSMNNFELNSEIVKNLEWNVFEKIF